MTVHLIAALGKRGQIGKAGWLPWARNVIDMAMFQRNTMGHVIIVGARTALRLPHLPGRDILMWHGDTTTPADLLALAKETYPGKPIWIAGGAHTYRAFAPHVNGLILLSAIDYDNDPAEDHRHVFFPFDAYGIRWSLPADEAAA